MTKARDIANAGTALATVDPTELGYLNGVTSAVQTQMDAKLATATASSTYLPTATAASTYLPTATAATTYSPLILTFNAQTGTTYTLVSTDANAKLVTMSNAGAVTLTIPPSIFTAGQTIDIQSIGAGLTTFAAGAGVTITSTGAAAAAPILRARYSACTVICTATNVFTVIGDIA